MKRFSPSDFELAWRLWPGSWGDAGLTDGRLKEMARRVLVDRAYIKVVCDAPSDCSNGHIGNTRLSKTVRAIHDQIYARRG